MDHVLYRVIRKSGYNGGVGCERVEGREVLYCGYDRLEALRVYHANRPVDRGAFPGSYFTKTVFQKKRVGGPAEKGVG